MMGHFWWPQEKLYHVTLTQSLLWSRHGLGGSGGAGHFLHDAQHTAAAQLGSGGEGTGLVRKTSLSRR